MRLDKYLKVSRLIKRRTVANEACDNARVTVNGRPAKAASEVKEGDMVRIVFGHREILVRVLEIRTSASKEQAFGMYEVVEEKKEEIV